MNDFDHLCGWLHRPEETDKFLSELESQGLPSLFCDAAPHMKDDGANKTALLYQIFRKVVGHDAPCGPQGIGDCLSFSWANISNYAQAVQLDEGNTNDEYEDVCTEAFYAISRVEIGGQRGSFQDGSCGAWGAKAATSYGFISRKLLGPYDPKRAKQWGATGLPNNLELEAKKHPIQRVALVTTYEQARDAIANKCVVSVCSNQGFTVVRDKDGFCTPQGIWRHAMSFTAMKDDNRPGLLCHQNWGTTNPTGPIIYDQPANCFWVDAEVCNKMLSLRDSYAASAFQGFIKPVSSNTLNWLL